MSPDEKRRENFFYKAPPFEEAEKLIFFRARFRFGQELISPEVTEDFLIGAFDERKGIKFCGRAMKGFPRRMAKNAVLSLSNEKKKSLKNLKPNFDLLIVKNSIMIENLKN